MKIIRILATIIVSALCMPLHAENVDDLITDLEQALAKV